MIMDAAHRSAPPFHEWPLVVFTTLAIMGAGLLATPLLAWVVAGTPAVAAGVLPWGTTLLGAGLVVSLAHLGKPLRAVLATLGLGRSRLSAEIALAGVALAVGGIASLLPYVSPWLDLVTALAATAFLASLGLVYSLPGQRTWRGAVVWMPLSSGLGFGAVSLAGQWGGAVVAIGAVAAVILAADAGLLILRRFALAWPAEPLTARHPELFARRQMLLAARFALVDILPGLCLFAGLPKGAAGLLALGILIDRLSFYGFSSQHTTEAEVQRIERMLDPNA
jgi:DMSO reductase anchor subunit